MPIAADYPFLNILWSMLVFVRFINGIWLAIMCSWTSSAAMTWAVS